MLEEENSNDKIKILEKIKNFFRDPLKFYEYSFLIFSLLTLIFYFTAVPDFQKFGSFIIATFMGIMCWNQIKIEMRNYHDR